MARARQAADDAEHKRQERDYADAHARAYVHEMYQGPWPIYRARLQDKVLAHLPRPSAVLDVGCGPIPSLPRIYDLAERYVCQDQSPECLRLIAANFPRGEVVEGDAETLAVQGPFDLAVIFGVLHHLPNPVRVVERVQALLRPGGVVVAMEPNETGESLMDSPNERGIADAEFDALYAPFEQLERWAWFDAAWWRRLLDSMTPQEQLRRWTMQEMWYGPVRDEEVWLREHPEGASMNVFIGRRK